MLSKSAISKIQKESVDNNNELPRLFSVLGDQTRWHIFTLLLQHEGLCVTDLANILNVSVPAVSQQLRVMEMSGLMQSKRNGQKICYEVDTNNEITKIIMKLLR